MIRLELMPRFGQEPELANGLFLRTWRGGPQKGEPKIPKAMQGMLDRGLVRIGTNPMGRAAAFFTESGLEGLRLLLQGRRVMDEEQAGLGSPGVDELRWLKPVYPGDTLIVKGRVLEKTPSRSKPDIGSFRTETVVTNQDGVPVMRFTSIVLIRRRPA